MVNSTKLNCMFTGLLKKKKPKLLGRGIGCGKGKTSGRGHKGQKARTGVSINGFEGGQQSIYTRLPKRGFNSINKKVYSIVNISDIQRLIDSGRIAVKDKVAIISKELLCELGFIESVKDKIKLLGDGKLQEKLIFEVDFASKSARESVIKAHGSVNILS